MPEKFDDDQDEFTAGPPPTDSADKTAILTGVSMLAACASFVYSVYRIGRGTLGHSPEFSLHIMPYAVAIDFVVLLFAIYALKESQAMEGTVARGMALAAVAISFLGGTIVGYSWYVFADLVRQAHG